MKLDDLLAGIDCQILNPKPVKITSLCCRADKAEEGALFFCIQGGRADGHDFALEAQKRGAVAFVCQKPIDTDKPQIIVTDVRRVVGLIAGAFYGHPIQSMKLVCITGTNGKTTTSYILRSIFSAHSVKSGLIGTTAYYVGEERRQADLTTPDPIELHKLFFDMKKAGCRVVVMELSAHAIALQKMAGVISDITVLTNITQDHLDFFGNFENYKKTKMSFFSPEHTRLAVVNADDPSGMELMLNPALPTVSYGADNPSDVFAINLKSSAAGISYVLNLYDRLWEIEFGLTGRFNMYNTMAAATAARFLGVPIETIAFGIQSIKRIEGRVDTLRLQNGATAVIDYAHTPNGVESVLKALNEIASAKVITVLGCGGERDRQKRPLMGAVAANLSDFLVLTNDNPRGENPDEIVADIITGLPDNTKFMVETDRRKAIFAALNMAEAGDIVAILGKGAENYQETAAGRADFSDFAVVQEADR